MSDTEKGIAGIRSAGIAVVYSRCTTGLADRETIAESDAVANVAISFATRTCGYGGMNDSGHGVTPV